MSVPFRVCYYHVVWATKSREPLLMPKIEVVAISAIMRKSTELESPVLAINGVPDHVHVAVSISTKLAVAEWVKTSKAIPRTR
jgi:putative transposase